MTTQQEELLNNIKATFALVQDPAQATAAQLQQSVNTLSGSISNLPGGEDIPRITRIKPLFSVQTGSGGAEFSVQGLGLSNGKPMLDLAGVLTAPDTVSDTEIRFPVPSHPAPGTAPVTVKGIIHLLERKGRRFFWSSLVQLDYPVLLSIYSRMIGRVQIIARRSIPHTQDVPKVTAIYRCQSGPRGGLGSRECHPHSGIRRSPAWGCEGPRGA